MDPDPGKPGISPERVEPEAAEEARRLEEERVEIARKRGFAGVVLRLSKTGRRVENDKRK